MFKLESSLGKNKRKGGNMKIWKRILLVLVIGSFMVGTAFAGVKEMKEAYVSKDYVTAISEAGKVIADANATIEDKAFAQRYIGLCYYRQKDYVKALPEFRKVISNYSGEKWLCAYAQRFIGYCYYLQKDYSKAITELQKVISNYSEVKSQCVIAQRYIGSCYEKIGKTVEAQEAWIQLCKMQGAPLSEVKIALSKLDKVALGTEEYLKLLDTMILAIPANEKNAEFLGILKSEQEKLK